MFHYGSKLGAKRAEVVQLMQKFVPRSHIGIFRNKRARSTHWILNSCFRVFLSVWVHLGLFSLLHQTRCKMGWVWCNYCKSSCHEVALKFFAMNAPDPPHWTQYSCFVAFHSVWVHLGPFHCFMILGSKQAELLQLMQKFVPQNRIRIFCNKSTRSTPSDPKLMFWCVS